MTRTRWILCGVIVALGLSLLPAAGQVGTVRPLFLAFGRTTLGVNVPIQVLADGTVVSSGGTFDPTSAIAFSGNNSHSGTETFTNTVTIPYYVTAAVTSVTSTSANSCGTTSPTLSTGSTNSAGRFTVGATSGSDCTLTFSVAAPHFWACGVSDTSTAVLVRAVPTSTTVTKVLGVLTASDVVQYACNAF